VPGAPTRAAGLAPLLGFQAGHTNSIAGMLGRVEGGAHDARLSVELALQTATQGALDCIGMRRGLWDGGRPGQQVAGMLPERSPAAGGGSASAGAGLDFGSGKWPGGKAAARAAALIVSRNFN
jgi:hypothetical protein